VGSVNSLPETSILFMGPFAGWGPRERGLLREAIQAKRLNLEVVVCCPLDSYLHVEARKHDLETFPIRIAKKSRWLGAYKEVFNFLSKRHNTTHFHCYDKDSLFSCAWFLRSLPQVALVWSIHGTPPTLEGNWWQKILLKRTDRFLLPSTLSLKRLSQQLRISSHKIARVGLAIDAREVAWKEPDLSDGFIVGLSLFDGAESINTTSVVTRALKLVLSRGIDNAKLLLHTPRDWQASVWRQGLEDLISELNLEKNVEFISGEDFSVFVGRLHVNIAFESDVVPFDHIETCLLAGIPVIYPRNRSYRDLLHGVDVGLFSYKPKDSREMAEKILKLYSSWSEQRYAMQSLREEHAKWHHPDLVKNQLEQVYKRTMLRRAKYWRKLEL
tara:strand:- start:55 stop:1209 length:1155 start_codon:yes stop_codon:yes gene_type:complete